MNIFDIINVPLGYLIRLAYQLTNNYAIALLLFAFVMQLLLIPLGIKRQKNQVKQATLAPKVAALRKKYAGRTDRVTQQKLQEETMELYQRENFNPMSGCLPLLIQMPILLALYQVVINPLKYVSSMSAELILKIQEAMTGLEAFKAFEGKASAIQQIDVAKFISDSANVESIGMTAELEGYLIPNFHFLGLDLSGIPQIEWPLDWLILIPIITLVASFATQWLMKKMTYQPPEQSEMQNSLSMKIMQYSMPFLSFYITFKVAAAIGLYWIFRNILQLAESFILFKLFPLPKFTAEDYRAAEKSVMTSSERKREKKQVRSLHHIDDEDYEQPAEAKPLAEDAPKIAPAALKEDRATKTDESAEDSEKK